MKNIEESSVEAGSEELGKPIVKGFITGVFAVVVDWAREHEHAIIIFSVIGVVIAYPVYRHYKTKKKVTAIHKKAKLHPPSKVYHHKF